MSYVPLGRALSSARTWRERWEAFCWFARDYAVRRDQRAFLKQPSSFHTKTQKERMKRA
jgi:hypothetical protein